MKSFRPWLWPVLLALGCATTTSAQPTTPPPPVAKSRILRGGGPPIPETPAVEPDHPPGFPLWEFGAPGFEGRRFEPEEAQWVRQSGQVFAAVVNIHHPSLIPFLPPPERATGTAVIIAPGGGARALAVGHEGYALARWLADNGVAAFVLKYRLALDSAGNSPYWTDVHGVADASRALRRVRHQAAEFGLRPERIGLLGFGTGGEIALLVATRHTPGEAGASDPAEQLTSRPGFVAAIYPSGLGRPDLLLTLDRRSTPPVFLSGAADDSGAVGLPSLATRFLEAKVPSELHLYARGGNGYGLRDDRPQFAVSSWHLRFLQWLGDQGLLTPP